MAKRKKAAECPGDGSQTQTSDAMKQGSRPDESVAMNADSRSAPVSNTSEPCGEAEASKKTADPLKNGRADISGGPGKVPNISGPARFPPESEGVA